MEPEPRCQLWGGHGGLTEDGEGEGKRDVQCLSPVAWKKQLPQIGISADRYNTLGG